MSGIDLIILIDPHYSNNDALDGAMELLLLLPLPKTLPLLNTLPLFEILDLCSNAIIPDPDLVVSSA